MKKHINKIISKRPFKNRKKKGELNDDAPRITNDTVAENREEVLSSARKYIYPLQHSKHRIILVSTGLLILLIITFLTYTTLALYRFGSSSTFMYRVTQVLPFPLARIDGTFVAYENYLFELRHYIHYYETQQDVDFAGETGRPQLEEFKRRALDKVINDAYIERLAKENGISVTEAEIDSEIDLVRSQNRLGNSEQVLEDVLKDFWDWSLQDFRRSLRASLLAQKVSTTLDKDSAEKVAQALMEIRGGTKFEDVAKKYSEDPATKEDGGEFPGLIERTNREFGAKTVSALYELKPGEVSDVINIGYALQIVKNLEKVGNKIRAGHILINVERIETYINEEKDQNPVQQYFSLPAVQSDLLPPPVTP